MRLKAILNTAKISDIIECLRDEARKNPEMYQRVVKKLQKPPQDYDIHAALVRECERGAKAEEGLSVERFLADVSRLEAVDKLKDAAELYVGMCDTVTEYMINYDWQVHFRDALIDVIRVMGGCIVKLERKQKQRYLSYMVKMGTISGYGMLEEYIDVLDKVCTKKSDYECLKTAIKPHLPNTEYVDHYTNDDGFDLTPLYIKALEYLQDDDLEKALKLYWKYHEDIGAAYLRYLLNTDIELARSLESKIVWNFKTESTLGLAAEAYDTGHPRRQELLKEQFYTGGKPDHYNALKKEIPNFETGEFVRNVRNYRQKAAIYVWEGMLDDAMNVAESEMCISVLNANPDLADTYPDRCYAVYKYVISDMAGGSPNRELYKNVRMHLGYMKSIPDHDDDFADFVRELQTTYRRRRVFLEYMADLVD